MKYMKDKESIIGQKVYVYWNLHKDVWSFMDQKGHVICHAHTFEMDDAELRVRPGGHLRAVQAGRKNVHAFAVGIIRSIDCELPEESEAISYNHAKGNTFYVVSTGEPIRHLDKCFGGNKVLLAQHDFSTGKEMVS